MSDIVDELKRQSLAKTNEARGAYVAIVRRAAEGKEEKNDIAILTEIVRELGMSPEDVGRDIDAVKSFNSAKRAYDELPSEEIMTGLAAEVRRGKDHNAMVARVHEEHVAAATEMGKDFNAALERRYRLQSVAKELQRTAENAAGLVEKVQIQGGSDPHNSGELE